MFQNIKEHKVEIGIYALIFGTFFWIYCTVPPVCDRLIERTVLYDLGNPIFYLFGQIRWFQNANARVLSNIFSIIIDRNIYVRAFVNALMMLGISYFVFSITNAKKIARIIYFVCLFLFSWGIQQEVYFYATTLYMGGIFLVTCISWIIKKEPKIKPFILYVLIFIASTWLESISLMTITISICALIRDYFGKKKRIIQNICMVIESILGFGIMYLSSKFASAGRLNKDSQIINLSGNHIQTVMFQNIGLLIVLSVIIMGITRQYYFQNKQISWLLQYIYWMIVSVGLIIWASYGIYCIISRDPSYTWAGDVIAWKNFKYDEVDKFYDLYCNVVHYVWPIAFVVSFISILLVLRRMKKIADGIENIFVMISGVAIDFLGIQNGDRIVFPGFFMLILLIVFLENEYTESICLCKKRLNIFIVIFCIIGFIQLEHIEIVLKNAKWVSDMRWNIANEIKLQQGLGKWNYENDVAVMPKYDEDGVPGGVNNQPEINSIRYSIMLRYYDLDENTKIIFD